MFDSLRHLIYKLPLFNQKGTLHDLQILSLVGIPLLLILSGGEGGYSICIFYNLTSLPCPGCGLTRSLYHLIHWNPVESLKFHPFGSAALLSMLFFIASAFSQNVCSIYKKFEKYLPPVIYTAAALLLLFGVVRAFALVYFRDEVLKYFYSFDDPSLMDVLFRFLKSGK